MHFIHAAALAMLKPILFIAMDRYQRVEKPRNETPIRENEIRITALGRMRNYIGYGMSLLEVMPLAMLRHFALSLSGVQ